MTVIYVNRAPFLALWATVVAKRLGWAEEEALTLGQAVTGLTAQAKGRKLGIYKEKPEAERARVEAEREAKGVDFLEFMDRLIPYMRTPDGLRALSGAAPISPEHVRRYLQSKFKEALPLVEEKLTALAATFEPEDLAGQAMDLYMRLRPKVPEGRAGWGQPGALDLARIEELIERRKKLAGGGSGN